MNSRVESSINRIAEQARGRYAAWLDSARTQTEQAAGRVRKGKKPVKTLSRLGVKLSDVSHRTTTKVLKQQTKMVENQIDAFAGRLKTAAHAETIGDLVRGQIRLIPENTSQFVSDSRAALSIVAEAGSEIRQLIAGSVSELRGQSETRTRTAKPAAKKPAAKKAKTKTRAKVKAKPAAKAADATPNAEPKAA